MKNRFLLIGFLFCALIGQAQEKKRKILFIGIDGCKSEVLKDLVQTGQAPNVAGLLPNAVYSWDALMWKDNTWSMNGWATLLTGVWPTKHLAYTNDQTDDNTNFETYRDLLTRLEQTSPQYRTAALTSWSPIRQIILDQNGTQGASFNYYPDDPSFANYNDEAIKNFAVNHLTTGDPDAFFVYFGRADIQGHNCCFDIANTAYRNVLQTTDTYIGNILTALRSRPTYTNEDWLVVVSTDHGGIGSGHGGSTLDERKIFVMFNSPSLTQQEIAPSTTTTTIANGLRFNGSNTAGRINKTSALNFGATQDFSIELWVKPLANSSDPAFLSDKNWNSGLNKGFFIGKNGSSSNWKVNIGDGSRRVDVDGGNIFDSQWHHLAITVDRDGQLSLFQDGLPVGNASMSTIGDITIAQPLAIAQDGTLAYPYWFNGYLAEVRIWNKVLTNEEIAGWSARRLTSSHPAYGNLIGYYPIDEGTGNVLTDRKGTNNGSISGTVSWQTLNDPFTVTSLAATPRQVDVAPTIYCHLTVTPLAAWNLDGRSWINSTNQPPSASGIPNQIAFVGQPFSLTIPGFSDPEGQPLKYSIQGLPTGFSVNATTGVLAGSASSPAGSPFSLTVTGTDPGGLSVSRELQLTISADIVATVKTGNWNDPTVWSINQVPLNTDPVLIRHVVTIPAGYTAQALRVSYEAGQRLVFGPSARLRLSQSAQLARRDSTFQLSEVISSAADRNRMGIVYDGSDFVPVGFYLPAGSAVRIQVTKTAGTRYPKLLIGTYSREYSPSDELWQTSVQAVQLAEGINTVTNPNGLGGLLYLRYSDNQPNGAATVRFISGMKPVPFYVLGKTTHDQWLQMLATLTDVPDVQLLGNRAFVVSSLANAMQYKDENQNRVLRTIDQVILSEDAISGLDSSSADHVPRKHRILLTQHENPNSYMYAYTGRTAYRATAMNYILRYNDLATDGWGPWHELGHMHQQSWRWDGLGEVTVNIYSLKVQRDLGLPSRLKTDNIWPEIMAYLAQPQAGKDFNASSVGVFVRLGMFQQLYLAFGDQFYINQHKAYRTEDPALADTAAKMRWFMLNSCRVSQKNLGTFFRKWGLNVAESVYSEINALGYPIPSVDPATLLD